MTFGRKSPSTWSLLLQASLHLHQFFLYLFVGVTAALFIYKGVKLPYPPTGAFAWEIVFLFLYYYINSSRIFQASKGNQTRQVAPLVLGMVLGAPIIVANVFFVQLQTYVLRLDSIFNGIALFLVSSETLLCLMMLLMLAGKPA